jgi:hypothetical protein
MKKTILTMLGITVLVNGKPVDPAQLTYANLRNNGQSDRTWLKRALDWAEKQAQTEKWAHIDLRTWRSEDRAAADSKPQS